MTNLDKSDHGRPQNIFKGWAVRGSEGRKSPSRVQGQLPGGEYGGEAARSRRHFLKMMHKYFVY